MKSIQSIVRQEIQQFIHNPITVVDGYEFNQYENVKKIHLYLNSRFYSGSSTNTSQPLVEGIDQEADDRIFFNITTPRVKAVKRFFDIDVADVLLDEIDPQSEMALQLLNKDFDRFAEEHDLAQDLNDFAVPYVEYGSLVIKVWKNAAPTVIPLQDYFVDPTVEKSADSRFNIIKHTMTAQALREKVADGWDSEAIEAIIKSAGEKTAAENSYEDDGGTNQVGSTSLIDVYERYGWIERGLIEETEDEEEIFALTFSADGGDIQKKGNKDADKDVVLYKIEWTDDLPIEDTHMVKTHGRWQGIGIPELLFGVQQRMNEVANQKRISMEISALHLFQTADPTVLNNILTDLENGDVVTTSKQGALAPIINEERNLPAFESEIVNYQTQGDKLSFANDLLSGGDIASSTPATNAVIQNNNQVLVHLGDRQNFTNFVGNHYIKRHVVPELIKEMDDEHFLRIVSEPEDLLQIDERLVKMNVWNIIKKRAMESGSVVDVFQQEDLEIEVRNKLRTASVNRYVKVIQGYYKKKVGDVLVIIGDEKRDMAKVAGNTLQFFNMIQNPAVLNDPVNRLFATQYGREIGIDTSRLELAFAKREAQPAPEALPAAGGSVKQRPTEKEDPALAQVL